MHREQHLAAAWQLDPGRGDGDPGCQQPGRAEARADGQHLLRPGGRERRDGRRIGPRIITVHGNYLGSSRPGSGGRCLGSCTAVLPPDEDDYMT